MESRGKGLRSYGEVRLGKLIAGGDSFTFGSELKGCYKIQEDGSPIEVYSPNAYSALLAKGMNLEYICTAVPGYSNSAIRRSTMDICEQHNDIDLVIVMWTFPNRYEFKFDWQWEQISLWSIEDNVEERIRKEFHNHNPIIFEKHLKKLQKEREAGITNFAKSFYRYVGHTDYWQYYSSLVEIVMLSNYLRLRNIRHLFTVADDFAEAIINNQIHSQDPSYQTLLDQAKKTNWFLFPQNKGFNDWAKAEKYPIGTTHPLDPAHIEAANLIYEHIRHLGWLP